MFGTKVDMYKRKQSYTPLPCVLKSVIGTALTFWSNERIDSFWVNKVNKLRGGTVSEQ